MKGAKKLVQTMQEEKLITILSGLPEQEKEPGYFVLAAPF